MRYIYSANVQPLSSQAVRSAPRSLDGNEACAPSTAVQMADELADFDEQLDEIISSHK